MDDSRFRSIFELAPCYLSVLDRDFRVVEANRRYRKDFGEIEGRTCYQIHKNRGEKCDDCPADLTFRDGQRHGCELQVKTVEGREITMIVYTTPIFKETGEIDAVLEMAIDITEIKLLQNQLRESRERYRQLFEEVPCYISIQDPDLRIVEANRRFREDFGEFLGCKCYQVYRHRSEECAPCIVKKTFEDGQAHQTEEVVTSRSGEHKNILVTTAPIRNSQGQIRSVMEMGANITQIRQLQSQLADLGLVIGSISHGIKGLLTSLDGGVYLVNSGMEKNNPERLKQGWEMVRRNVARIRSMVLDLLYYAKDREPEWTPTQAPAIAEEVFGLLQGRAKDEGIDLRAEIAPDAGEFEADPKAVRSLLINLAENSIDACRVDKKKKDHRVVIGVKALPEHVEFFVSDNGIGMDQETREKAFSLFFSSKRGNGTGLGLFISNKIAQAHGGEIKLESELNQGTRMIVTLPRKRPAKAVSSNKD